MAGLGPGAGIAHPSTGSSGAGHGGRGGSGKNQFSTGAFYGDVFRPQSFGSSGGGGFTPGGGVLHVSATALLLDGSIEVNGKSAGHGTVNGGGSGGSVFLQAGVFDGSGVVQANGGSGGSSGGGGGSGGRIAVHYKKSFFSGVLTAYGGDSPVEAGAAGTIYRKNTDQDYSALEVYNLGRAPGKLQINSFTDLSQDSARTWLTQSTLGPQTVQVNLDGIDVGVPVYDGFSFNEVKLGGSAHLAIEPDNRRVRLHTFRKFSGTFQGGSFGYVHVGPKQFLVIAETDYYIPVNPRIYQSGYIQLPPRIMLHKNSLSLDAGYLVGVQELTISECSVVFGVNSAAQKSGTLQPMFFDFQSITLMNGGNLRLAAASTKYHLNTKSLLINPGGVLQGKNVAITAEQVIVEESGQINFDGQGHSCAATDVTYSGSGGSHAGYGGLGIGALRKEPFDSVFLPTLFGLAGLAGRSSPACNGGFGGGVLNLTVTGTVWMDGTISAR